jgi:4-hydroxy-tetrahydrodipicolinate synthase
LLDEAGRKIAGLGDHLDHVGDTDTLYLLDHIIADGHPTYGHQCYSKALAAAAGYPIGDVRAPLTTFKELGGEGKERLKKITAVMAKLDELMAKIDRPLAAE